MNDAGIKPVTSPRREIGRGEKLIPNEPAIISDIFVSVAERFPDAKLLNYKHNGSWQSISASEVLEQIEAAALGLHSLGLRNGDRAAILAPNSPEWTIADGACQFAGFIDVPIYTTLAPASVNYILKDSGSRVIFFDRAETYESFKDSIWDETPIEKVVLFQGDLDDDRIISFDDLLILGNDLAAENGSLAKELRTVVKPDEIATLIYTSGTTGEPKGVMLSQNNIISNVIDAGEKYEFSTDDVPLSVLPLSHIFERSAMYLYIFYGMSVHYAESIDKVPDNLIEVRPTIFVGVPRIFEKVYARAKVKASQAGAAQEKIFDVAIDIAKKKALASEKGEAASFLLSAEHLVADKLVFSKFRDFFGGRLRACITGGAALPDDIYLIFMGAGVSIMQGYGLTETSPVLTSNNEQEFRLGSVGKPIHNVEVRIAADGEIEATGPGVMHGYYNKPEATREAFTDDGWFRTGDIGRIDDDGFLFVTDRKKELFKTSGGKYIAPSPIEQMIRSSRFVSQAVLIGNERKFASALIVPNFEMLESYAKHKGLSISTPKEFCSDPKIIDLFERQIAAATKGLARYETVKKVALLENELSVDGGELTPTMKIKRRVVDEKYKDVIDGLYYEK